jgi:hypothetical protein
MKYVIRRMQSWWTARRRDDEVAEELEFHRTLTEERLRRGGLAADEAARRMLGNVALARADARGVWIPRWIDDARQDTRHASA